MEVVIDERVLNKRVSFLPREATLFLCLVFYPEDHDIYEVYKQQRLQAMFSMGVHYVLMPDGTVYQTLKHDDPADITYPDNDTCLYAMAVGCAEEAGMTSAQKKAWVELAAQEGLPVRIVQKGE